MLEWKILIADGLHEEGLAILRSAGEVDDRSGITATELINAIEGYNALVVRSRTKVTAAVFEKGKRLQVIGRAGVGVDNIDLAAANLHKVTVINAPQSTSIAVAELTLGLMLSLARALPRADAAMKSGQWPKDELDGIELYGKTLGLIGMGNIGSALAQRASCLGMIVLGYDEYLSPQIIHQRCAEAVLLDELLARADFISLHIPFNPDTKAMINGQTIAKMKRGVRLICTARGGIIDDTALLGALESGQVAGAALDVYAKEPPGLNALVAHPKVIATPHIGAQTFEAQARAAIDIAKEVLAALRGDTLKWRIV